MQRPTGVTVIAVLYFISGGIIALVAILLMVGAGAFSTMATQPGMRTLMIGLGTVGAVVLIILGALAIFVGYGLWTQQNWARIVAIVLAALGLLGSLPGLFALSTLHVGVVALCFALVRIGINVLIIWYLLQPDVRQAFRVA